MKKREKAFLGVKLDSVFTVFTVSVSSLLPECGWHRNPSKAFYQAFQSGSRLRGSKAHIDRYSTGLVRAGLQESNIVCAVFSSSELCFLHVHGLSLETKPGSKRRIGQSGSVFPLPLTGAWTQSLSGMVDILCHFILLTARDLQVVFVASGSSCENNMKIQKTFLLFQL